MCSGCSGDYEGDGDGWDLSSTSSEEEIDGDRIERAESTRLAASRIQMRGPESGESRNQAPTCEDPVESEYEVLVSADEIIEIRRIACYFAGLL
jgi:hypothetical protein